MRLVLGHQFSVGQKFRPGLRVVSGPEGTDRGLGYWGMTRAYLTWTRTGTAGTRQIASPRPPSSLRFRS
jgi:hypothetical protein